MVVQGVLPWRSAGERHALVLRYGPFNGSVREMSEELQARLPPEVNALRQGKL
jgi:hypothetical protein